MPLAKVIILAVVQGLAELLPVSSSAHVVVAEKQMGLNPSSPEMTLLLVMLHTGTMFAVIAYFWKTWRQSYFSSGESFRRFGVLLIWATVLTAIVGFGLQKVIEKTYFRGAPKAEIEQLFSHLELIAPALAVVGLVILLAGLLEHKGLLSTRRSPVVGNGMEVGNGSGSADAPAMSCSQAGWMGIVQGLALPFRGFSRSGSTISVGMMTGAAKDAAERFSFALAVVLTPPIVARELLRLLKASHGAAASVHVSVSTSLQTSAIGMLLSFVAGLVALKWLSSWLENGRWYLFGLYCLGASAVVFYLYSQGF